LSTSHHAQTRFGFGDDKDLPDNFISTFAVVDLDAVEKWARTDRRRYRIGRALFRKDSRNRSPRDMASSGYVGLTGSY
jgi:hypothetical protein